MTGYYSDFQMNVILDHDDPHFDDTTPLIIKLIQDGSGGALANFIRIFRYTPNQFIRQEDIYQSQRKINNMQQIVRATFEPNVDRKFLHTLIQIAHETSSFSSSGLHLPFIASGFTVEQLLQVVEYNEFGLIIPYSFNVRATQFLRCMYDAYHVQHKDLLTEMVLYVDSPECSHPENFMELFIGNLQLYNQLLDHTSETSLKLVSRLLHSGVSHHDGQYDPGQLFFSQLNYNHYFYDNPKIVGLLMRAALNTPDGTVNLQLVTDVIHWTEMNIPPIPHNTPFDIAVMHTIWQEILELPSDKCNTVIAHILTCKLFPRFTNASFPTPDQFEQRTAMIPCVLFMYDIVDEKNNIIVERETKLIEVLKILLTVDSILTWAKATHRRDRWFIIKHTNSIELIKVLFSFIPVPDTAVQTSTPSPILFETNLKSRITECIQHEADVLAWLRRAMNQFIPNGQKDEITQAMNLYKAGLLNQQSWTVPFCDVFNTIVNFHYEPNADSLHALDFHVRVFHKDQYGNTTINAVNFSDGHTQYYIKQESISAFTYVKLLRKTGIDDDNVATVLTEFFRPLLTSASIATLPGDTMPFFDKMIRELVYSVVYESSTSEQAQRFRQQQTLQFGVTQPGGVNYDSEDEDAMMWVPVVDLMQD